MYIVIGILVFGVLIMVHELGHFIAARLCGVKVEEFALGMGPVILKKQGKETKYSLRLLPIGGFCAMVGEDEAVDDPRAFSSKPIWKRFIILVAGSLANFLAGFLVIIVLFSSVYTTDYFVGSTITDFADGFPLEGESGLMVGDTILKINGERISSSSNFSTFMSRSNGQSVDMLIERNGEKIILEDFPLVLREYETDGEMELRYGVTFNRYEATIGAKLTNSWYTAMDFVRLVRLSLVDLFSGGVGLDQLSGPVGIVSIISETGESAESASDAAANIAYLCAFIAINIAVMNILPIPALDGGRIFFMIVTFIIEKITRRKVNPKYEGYIHAGTLVLLLGLMAFVMVGDILRIING